MSGRDMLLFGLSQTQRFEELIHWAQCSGVHEFVPDFHRLQLEHWIWLHRARLEGCVIDVGVQIPRRWLGAGYRTMGLHGCDLIGDLRAMPVQTASVDGMIVTEVLEHCEQPFEAVAEMWRVLKPGSILLVTSPFIWPWHGTSEYRDFWRFTHDGWSLLFKEFAGIKITPCEWTDEGKDLYGLLRRFECMGHKSLTRASTGYLCEVMR